MGTEKSGGHVPGLLAEMGYSLPPGAATVKRREIMRKALRDLQAVVEEAFGGIVAGKRGDNWVTLKAAENLPVDIVLKSISWFIFLPPEWRKKIPQVVEAYHAERLAKGETPYQVKVTEDRRLAEAGESSRGLPGEAVGLDSEALWIRLYSTRRERKISQATVGELFGVSQQIVAGWEKGLEPGEDGKVRGKAIPADVVPLLLRWIENGPPPTEEELDALSVRRAVRPGVEKI
jgi:DNA-binding XRE family transcriptional regulator